MRIPELEALIERFGPRATLAAVLEILSKELITPPSVLRAEAIPAPEPFRPCDCDACRDPRLPSVIRADSIPVRPMPEVVRKGGPCPRCGARPDAHGDCFCPRVHPRRG